MAAVLSAYGIAQAIAIAVELAGLPPTTDIPRMPVGNAMGLLGLPLAGAAYVVLGRISAARGWSGGEAAAHGALAGAIAGLVGGGAQALAALHVFLGIGGMYGVAAEHVVAALAAGVFLLAAAGSAGAAIVTYAGATVLPPRVEAAALP